jgi:threonine 3-dehydrogenase
VHNYEPRHLADAVDFLGRTLDVYPWAGLVSEPVQLDDLANALEPAPPGKLRASVAP